ncbi:phosphate ABC transporter substrate-binding protein [Pseudomaricurvus alcaniphilus]|uniref:phosphate ABC transporter substrate-binding protein n=1 Tax=Pseudomaricurvus alcaniphilus TaxID=1166482 RepID=UPI001FB82D0A|nr:phosphate ABC transporter substrate-binding protein [Pseudomaricurvus alcaniphilus]
MMVFTCVPGPGRLQKKCLGKTYSDKNATARAGLCRAAVALLGLLLLLASQSLWAASQRLVLTGSSTVAPLALEMAKRYEQQHPGVRIDVQTGGSSRGILDARRGLADIGMVSRALQATEGDLTAYTIAMDGIGIIVHRSNSVAALTDQQIVAIYRGQIRNWREVGGADRPITVVNKAEGRSTLELFLQYFGLKNSQIRAQVIIGDNQQGIKTVAGNPGAIGYVSIGSAEYEEQRGTALRLLPMAGHSASVANVARGEFPLARQLNLVVVGQSSPLAQQFIAFAQSESVRDLISAQFFVAP